MYYGWHFSKKHIDSQSYTILAIIFIIYAYYKWVDDSFSFLNAIGQIDCFQLLAFALLIGFVLGKIFDKENEVKEELTTIKEAISKLNSKATEKNITGLIALANVLPNQRSHYSQKYHLSSFIEMNQFAM